MCVKGYWKTLWSSFTSNKGKDPVAFGTRSIAVCLECPHQLVAVRMSSSVEPWNHLPCNIPLAAAWHWDVLQRIIVQEPRNLLVLGHWLKKMSRTGKTPVYNHHVWDHQNQGKICPRLGPVKAQKFSQCLMVYELQNCCANLLITLLSSSLVHIADLGLVITASADGPAVSLDFCEFQWNIPDNDLHLFGVSNGIFWYLLSFEGFHLSPSIPTVWILPWLSGNPRPWPGGITIY